MRRVSLLLVLLACLALPGQAQDEDRMIHSASDMQKPAIYGYLANEFFHQRYQAGPVPIWESSVLLLALDLVLLLDLWRRRGWLR